MRAIPLLGSAAFMAAAAAEKHELFGGYGSSPEVYRLTFDDEASTLTLTKNITTVGTSSSMWVAFDWDKSNLYISSTGAFLSYAITDDLDLVYQSNVSMPADCNFENYIQALKVAPYTVFTLPYDVGCSGLAVSVDESGALDTPFANITLESTSAAHGIDLSPDNRFIYSADDAGNAVWTHAYDIEAGTITALQKLSAPNGSDPRHLVVHPAGDYVYVANEKSNKLGIYTRDSTTGLLTDTNQTYDLIPSSFTNTSYYEADEVKFSVPQDGASSPKYLLASVRCIDISAGATANLGPGYVSGFGVDETGAITEQLFLLPTTASGGGSNAITPADWSEDYFVIADESSDFIEVWKIADDGSSAEAVAHLGGMTGAPANVIWYS